MSSSWRRCRASTASARGDLFGMTFQLQAGERIDQRQLLTRPGRTAVQAQRPGVYPRAFRVRGDTVECSRRIYEDRAWRLSLFGDEIESITEFDPLTGQKTAELEQIEDLRQLALCHAQADAGPGDQAHQASLNHGWTNSSRRPLLEAQRLEQRTLFDHRDDEATGRCAGIENYSRYLTGPQPGEPPPTLFEYLPDNACCFVDESHVTVPQIGGMFKGDFNRKATLAEFGFRLPSCHRQPPAALRGMGRHAPADRARVGDTGNLGNGTHRRRVCRTGHPPHRPDRPAGGNPPRGHPGRRPDGRMSRWWRSRVTGRWSPC